MAAETKCELRAEQHAMRKEKEWSTCVFTSHDVQRTNLVILKDRADENENVQSDDKFHSLQRES